MDIWFLSVLIALADTEPTGNNCTTAKSIKDTFHYTKYEIDNMLDDTVKLFYNKPFSNLTRSEKSKYEYFVIKTEYLMKTFSACVLRYLDITLENRNSPLLQSMKSLKFDDEYFRNFFDSLIKDYFTELKLKTPKYFEELLSKSEDSLIDSGNLDYSFVDNKSLQDRSGLEQESHSSSSSSSKKYPEYKAIPKTSFDCNDKKYIPGFYADNETDCQVFHVCYPTRRETFLCPISTIFNQINLTCDLWSNFICEEAPKYFYINKYLSREYNHGYLPKTDDSIFGELTDPNYTPKRYRNTLHMLYNELKYPPVASMTTYYPGRLLLPNTAEFHRYQSVHRHGRKLYYSTKEVVAIARLITDRLRINLNVPPATEENSEFEDKTLPLSINLQPGEYFHAPYDDDEDDDLYSLEDDENELHDKGDDDNESLSNENDENESHSNEDDENESHSYEADENESGSYEDDENQSGSYEDDENQSDSYEADENESHNHESDENKFHIKDNEIPGLRNEFKDDFY